MWGPGRRALPHWYEKRLEIVKALREADTRYEVLTSEEIFDQDPSDDRHNLEAAQLELLQAREAHMIIALVVGQPNTQGGVYRELDLISQYRDLREKTWIFLPAQRSYERNFQAGSLTNFRASHLIAYLWPELRECQSIRKVCIEKAGEEYGQLLLDNLQATIRG